MNIIYFFLQYFPFILSLQQLFIHATLTWYPIKCKNSLNITLMKMRIKMISISYQINNNAYSNNKQKS